VRWTRDSAGAPAANRLPQAAGGARGIADRLPTLDELERSHIRRVLETCNGHRENAARILGISERNLYRKIHELGL